MSELVTIFVDGAEIQTSPGKTVLQACDAVGVFIPRLCYRPDLIPAGRCRLCTVRINGRYAGACYTPVANGMVIEHQTPELQRDRARIIEMLFVEGNHICPECEKTGNCDLQACAYRLNMLAPTLPYRYVTRDIDATNPEVFIDRSRCILCGMCDVASRHVDKKTVFAFENRNGEMRIAVDSRKGLIGTPIRASDKAAQVCPVGSILIKGTAFQSPYGERTYDSRPIGADIEEASKIHGAVSVAEPEGNDQT